MATDDTTRPLSADLGLEEREAAATASSTPDPTDGSADTTAPAASPSTTAHTAGPAPAPAGPRYRPGPAPFALLLGILGLLTAGAVLVTELSDVSIPWSDLGPWTIVGGGALVLIVGLVGLRSSRAQD